MGSAERIADAAILAGDVLIERFIGSAGGEHIKEQQLIRAPPPPPSPFTFIYSILKSYLLYLFILSLYGGPERNTNWLLLHFPFFCVLLCWRTVHRYRWLTASAAAFFFLRLIRSRAFLCVFFFFFWMKCENPATCDNVSGSWKPLACAFSPVTTCYV